jgi:hypothetical protein
MAFACRLEIPAKPGQSGTMSAELRRHGCCAYLMGVHLRCILSCAGTGCGSAIHQNGHANGNGNGRSNGNGHGLIVAGRKLESGGGLDHHERAAPLMHRPRLEIWAEGKDLRLHEPLRLRDW